MSSSLNLREKLLYRSRSGRVLGRFAYMALILLGVEVPRGVPLGQDVRLAHGAVGLVIHESTRIGDRVLIFSGVTVGRSDQYAHGDELSPGGGVAIGHDVVLGSGAKILFRSGRSITIGDGAVIGANAVVNTDVPPGEIWAGIPARKLHLKDRHV